MNHGTVQVRGTGHRSRGEYGRRSSKRATDLWRKSRKRDQKGGLMNVAKEAPLLNWRAHPTQGLNVCK